MSLASIFISLLFFSYFSLLDWAYFIYFSTFIISIFIVCFIVYRLYRYFKAREDRETGKTTRELKDVTIEDRETGKTTRELKDTTIETVKDASKGIFEKIHFPRWLKYGVLSTLIFGALSVPLALFIASMLDSINILTFGMLLSEYLIGSSGCDSFGCIGPMLQGFLVSYFLIGAFVGQIVTFSKEDEAKGNVLFNRIIFLVLIILSISSIAFFSIKGSSISSLEENYENEITIPLRDKINEHMVETYESGGSKTYSSSGELLRTSPIQTRTYEYGGGSGSSQSFSVEKLNRYYASIFFYLIIFLFGVIFMYKSDWGLKVVLLMFLIAYLVLLNFSSPVNLLSDVGELRSDINAVEQKSIGFCVTSNCRNLIAINKGDSDLCDRFDKYYCEKVVISRADLQKYN